MTTPSYRPTSLGQLRHHFPELGLRPGRNCDDTTPITLDASVDTRLSGFYHPWHPPHFAIIGRQEAAHLAPDALAMLKRCACLIIADGLTAPAVVADADTPYLLSEASSERINAKLLAQLPELVQPVHSEHGVLLAVHNQGLLLTGAAGIGKSSLALALLQRGHYLVADDTPEFFLLPDGRISGHCPANLYGFLHCRSLGMIDIGRSYGAAACLRRFPLDGIIHLTQDPRVNENNWLQPDSQRTILGQSIPLRLLSCRNPWDAPTLVELFAKQLAMRHQGLASAATRFSQRFDHITAQDGRIKPSRQRA